MTKLKIKPISTKCALAASLMICMAIADATPNLVRYYRFDLTVEVNQKPYNVAYNWHCTRVLDGPNFGPGGFLKARWKITPSTKFLVRDIGSGAVFTVIPPNSCGNESDQTTVAESHDDFRPVMVVDSVDRPTLVQKFVRGKAFGYGYVVHETVARISQLSSAAPDSEPSPDEKRVSQALLGSTGGYQSVWARVLPKAIWARSAALSAYLEHATGIQIAPLPTHIQTNIVGRDGRNNYFPIDQRGVFPPQGFDYDSYTVSLRKAGDEWVLPPGQEADQALTYVLDSSGLDASGGDCARVNPSKPARVAYDQTQVVVAKSQQIFDSRRQLLIQFINSCRSLSSILTIDIGQ